MSNQNTSILIEIPSDIPQEEVWSLEEKLKEIKGVTSDLQEPKDLFGTIMLVLNVATTTLVTVGGIGGGITSIHDVTKIIYNFLHSKHKEIANEASKKKVVIIKKGKRVELYNLSFEEIEKIIKEQ